MDYWGSQNDSLWDDMFRLLGPDVVNLTDMNGEILPEKLTVLKVKRVKFDITHETRPEFKVTYRKVKNLHSLKKAASRLVEGAPVLIYKNGRWRL